MNTLTAANKAKRKFYPIEDRAFHEAGHAVAATMQGIHFDCVTIKLSTVKTSNGKVRSSGHLAGLSVPRDPHNVNDYTTNVLNEPEVFAHWQSHVVISMAGPAAHRKHNPDAPPGYAFTDTDMVWDAIRTSIHPNSGWDVRQAYFDFAKALAADFVEREWPKIDSVARALLERKTLTGDEVHEIVNGTSTL